MIESVHALMQIGPGDQGYVGGDRRGRGIEGMYGKRMAVDSRSPSTFAESVPPRSLGPRRLPEGVGGRGGEFVYRDLLQVVEL